MCSLSLSTTLPNTSSACPSDDALRGLLLPSVLPGLEVVLVRHLDGCSSCRERLEELAAGQEFWAEIAQHLGQLAERLSDGPG